MQRRLSDHRTPSSSSPGELLLEQTVRAPPACLRLCPRHAPSSATTHQSRAGKQTLLWDQQDSAFCPLKAHSLVPPRHQLLFQLPQGRMSPCRELGQEQAGRGTRELGNPSDGSSSSSCLQLWQLHKRRPLLAALLSRVCTFTPVWWPISSAKGSGIVRESQHQA